MTKNEYLTRLAACLSDLPADKKTQALAVCENRFRINGADREAETARELGAPEAVAGSMLRRWQEEQEKKSARPQPIPVYREPFPDFEPKINFVEDGFVQPPQTFSGFPEPPQTAEPSHPTESVTEDGEPQVPEMPKMPEFDTRILHNSFLYGKDLPEQIRQAEAAQKAPEEPMPEASEPEHTEEEPLHFAWEKSLNEQEPQETSTQDNDFSIPRQPHGYRYDRSRGGWLAPEDWTEGDYPEEYGEEEEEEIVGEEKKPPDPQTRAKRKKQLRMAGVAAAAVVVLLILIPLVRGVGRGVSFLLSGLVLCFSAGLILAVKGLGTFFNGLTMLPSGPLNGALCASVGLLLCGAGCILFGITLAALIKGVPILITTIKSLIHKLRKASQKGGETK